MKKMILAAAIASFFGLGVQAARIDLGSTDAKLAPGTNTVGTLSNATWNSDPEKNAKYLIFNAGEALPEWQEAEFSFKPDKDGEVTFNLLGPWKKSSTGEGLDPVWVVYDDITVTGSTIKNGTFDTGMESWNKTVKGGDLGIQPEHILATGHSKPGSVKCWHDGGLSQKIPVKMGQTVTVKFWYKSEK